MHALGKRGAFHHFGDVLRVSGVRGFVFNQYIKIEGDDRTRDFRHSALARAEPCFEICCCSGSGGRHGILGLTDLLQQRIQLFFRSAVRQFHHRGRHNVREVLVCDRAGLVDVLKECRQRIEIPLRQRIKFVIMATRTIERQPQNGGAKCHHPIVHVCHPVFLVYDAAFFILCVEAIERGRQPLVTGGTRQQISRNLFGQKLVVR